MPAPALGGRAGDDSGRDDGSPCGERRSRGPAARRERVQLRGHLGPVTIAYESWGTLNAAKDNAILVEHALTGDAHVVGPRGPGQPSPGWWEGLIGPNAPLDTERFFVMSTNVLGGCMASTGPSSLAEDGKPYGSRFPRLTIRDQVAAEIAADDALGIDTFAAVIDDSMGGMRAL